MQVLMIVPLCFHLWNIRKDKKRCVIEGVLSLCLCLVATIFSYAWISAILLFLYLLMDTRMSYILYAGVAVLFLLTYPLSYAVVVWIIMEIILVCYDKMLIKTYEEQMQEYQNKVFARQVQEVEHMYTTMRGWRHDYHNHLQNLKAKLHKHEVDESLQYLDELEQELSDIHQLVETGNANMDAILNSKLSLAVSEGITLHVKAKVPEKITISDTDICALLGNMVDNVVEACAKVEENSFIRLYIGMYKGQLYISCTNSTNEVIRKLDSEYITTKRGNHGHGLKRMNLIVEKYQGFIQRKNEPGVFTTEIMLPL